jgi:hypothetical protein
VEPEPGTAALVLLDDGPGTIGAAVVDEDELEIGGEGGEEFLRTLDVLGDAFFLVEGPAEHGQAEGLLSGPTNGCGHGGSF